MEVFPTELENALQNIKKHDEEENEDEEAEPITLNQSEVMMLFEVLTKQLSSSNDKRNWKLIHKVLETIGDLAREGHHRRSLTEQLDQLIAAVSPYSNSFDPSQPTETQRLVARAVGNVCYENGNVSSAFDKEKVVAHFVQYFTQSDEQVSRNTAGALANLASDSAEIQNEIVALGGLPPLIKLLYYTKNTTCQVMAARALNNISDEDANLVRLVEEKGMEAFFSLAKSDDENLHKELLNFISSAVSNDEVRPVLVTKGGVEILMNVVQHNEDFEDIEEDLESLAWESLLALAEKENSTVYLVTSGAFTTLLDMLKQNQPKVTKNVYKIFGNLSLDDRNIDPLFQYYDEVVKTLDTTDLDVLLSVLMVLGNLARSDGNCQKMVSSSAVLKKLMELCHHKDARVVHLAVGVFRNLSIPAENKTVLVDLGVFKTLIAQLEEKENPHLHVQYVTIGAIKSLIAGGGPLMDAFVKEGGLQPLIAIARGEVVPRQAPEDEEGNPKERDRRVEYEAARILVRYASTAEYQDLIVDGGIEPLLELIKTSYEILQAEGLKAVNTLTEKHVNALKKADTVSVVEKFESSNAELKTMKQKILAALQ